MSRDAAFIKDGEIDWALLSASESRFANCGLDDSNLTPVPWNDAYFKKTYVDGIRICKKPDLSESLIFARAFLNWYSSRVVPKFPCDIILGVFYGMTTDGYVKDVFDEYLWTSEGSKTLDNPGDVKQLSEFNYSHKLNKIVTTGGYKAPRDTGPEASSSRTQQAVTQNSITKSYTQLWDFLSKTDTDKDRFAAKMALNFIGFLAMNMLRLSTKDSEAVSTHIFKTVKNRFMSLWNTTCPVDNPYPPHFRMSERFSILFGRLRPNANKCLAALVYSYGESTPLNGESIRDILGDGCLLSLRMTGLGILRWTLQAASTKKVSPMKLMRYMAVDPHTDTNMAMLKLLANFADPEANQHSWPWARIFANGAFLDLAIISNPLYAAVMLAICTNLNGNDALWGISSMKVVDKGQKNVAIAVAARILTDISKSDR